MPHIYQQIRKAKKNLQIDRNLIYYIAREGEVLIVILPNKMYLYVYSEGVFAFTSVIYKLESYKIAQK